MKITVVFEPEKDTKRTIRFKEVMTDPLGTPLLGTIYVPKTTLKQIGFKDKLVVEISA